jgi:hypothetical protein
MLSRPSRTLRMHACPPSPPGAVDQQVEPGQLYALQHTLAEQQAFYPNEIEEFARVFFKPKQAQTCGSPEPKTPCFRSSG